MIQTHLLTATSLDSDKKDPNHHRPLAPFIIRIRICTARRGYYITRASATRTSTASAQLPVSAERGLPARPGSALCRPSPGWGRGTARPALGPLSSHLFERRLFRRARAGGTGRSQKRKMVPRILTSHLYIPGPSSSGGRHTPRRKPQSCRRRCRLRCLGHQRQSSVADL